MCTCLVQRKCAQVLCTYDRRTDPRPARHGQAQGAGPSPALPPRWGAADRGPGHRDRSRRRAQHQLRRHQLPPAQARERRAGRRHRRWGGEAAAVGGCRRRDPLRPQRLRRRRRRRVRLRLARARLAAALHREVRPLARPAAQLARLVDRRRRHERHDDRRHQRPARGHARRDRRGRRALPAGRPGQPRGQAGRGLRVLLPGRHGQGPRHPGAAMTTHLTARAAERRYYLLTTTRWLPVGFVVGIFILVMTSRGLTIAQAATIGSVMGFTCFFLELPTSGFADAVGRRPVYLTAAVINVVAITAYAVAQSFWAFIVAGALMGAFRALDSGPLEAWFVDTVHETTPGVDVDRPLSRAGSILGGVIAIGAVLSGLLIWWNPAATVFGREDASALDVAVWVSAILSVVHLVAAWVVMKEPHP